MQLRLNTARDPLCGLLCTSAQVRRRKGQQASHAEKAEEPLCLAPVVALQPGASSSRKRGSGVLPLSSQVAGPASD